MSNFNMLIGTNCFQSLQTAIEYYLKFNAPTETDKRKRGYKSAYAETKKQVLYKLENEEIKIGYPETKKGQKILLDKQEGRYFIQE